MCGPETPNSCMQMTLSILMRQFYLDAEEHHFPYNFLYTCPFDFCFLRWIYWVLPRIPRALRGCCARVARRGSSWDWCPCHTGRKAHFLRVSFSPSIHKNEKDEEEKKPRRFKTVESCSNAYNWKHCSCSFISLDRDGQNVCFKYADVHWCTSFRRVETIITTQSDTAGPR